MDDVVITMLADDAAVESVAFGDHGVIGSLGKGAIHVSTSTISVALSERLTAAHAKAGPLFDVLGQKTFGDRGPRGGDGDLHAVPRAGLPAVGQLAAKDAADPAGERACGT